MNFDFMQLSTVFMVLFGIIDIVGSIPIILTMKERGEKIHPLNACLVALSILVLFLFAGEFVLKLFRVDVASFAIAGSLIIFIFALEMILDVEIYKNKGPKGVSSIVPIAFPLVAGPASFTTLLSLRAEYNVLNILIALVLNIIFVYFVLRFTTKIERIIGKGGIYIIRKFFGIILLAISVKLFTTNVEVLLKNI